MRISVFLLKGFYYVYNQLLSIFGTLYLKLFFNIKTVKSNGFPYLDIGKSGILSFGKNCKINNGERFNPIGRQSKCVIIVGKNAVLTIGSNFGMSSSSIVCTQSITIGDHVKVGGNVCIYDTDFHSLNFLNRRTKNIDLNDTVKKSITIGDDVFIGAHSIILKGVRIGDKAIIGAGSIVSKDIGDGEIWAGNPAKFIRKIDL